MKPEKIILHHSLTKDSKAVSWGAIRRYHMGDLGWQNIGYHFGIEDINGQYEILLGRMLNRNGAHCQGMNGRSLGVCFVGNFDYAPPPPDQWARGLELVKWLLHQYGLKVSDVEPHRKYAKKTCPGRLFDIGLFRDELKKGG